ncbi:hypothetical protein P5P86_10670 [Nocardioides sp. BP30]|uniref:hypothetical protein n=1 Tax=Nocardioides sp. BP30 TaxID=3036374 RepID=UPI0024697866|nr:hypothetical protein [Nocardioides sp. BP30]WGL50430.1 hypothetical protein P5P86_10670 [Nocardioides sp. BP30]
MTALSITLALVAVVAAALALVAVIAGRRALTAASRREQVAEQDLAEMRERLAVLEQRTRPGARSGGDAESADDREFVITRLGSLEALEADGTDRAPAQVSLTAPAFADAVLRETVVQTASLAHGLRRALAPETRNRIRFEMRRELKRSRKERRLEAREALREYRARRRAGSGPTTTPTTAPAPGMAAEEPDAGVA